MNDAVVEETGTRTNLILLATLREQHFNNSWKSLHDALQNRLLRGDYISTRMRNAIERDLRITENAINDENNGKTYYALEGMLYTVLIPTRKNGQAYSTVSQE